MSSRDAIWVHYDGDAMIHDSQRKWHDDGAVLLNIQLIFYNKYNSEY